MDDGTRSAWNELVEDANRALPFIAVTSIGQDAILAVAGYVKELELTQLDHALAMQYLTQLLKSHTRVVPATTLAGLCSQIDNLLTGGRVKLPNWTGVIETPVSANPGASTNPGGMDDGVYRVDGSPAETGEPGTAHFERLTPLSFDDLDKRQ